MNSKQSFYAFYHGYGSECYWRSYYYYKALCDNVELSYTEREKRGKRNTNYSIIECYLTLCKQLDCSVSKWWLLEVMITEEKHDEVLELLYAFDKLMRPDNPEDFDLSAPYKPYNVLKLNESIKNL